MSNNPDANHEQPDTSAPQSGGVNIGGNARVVVKGDLIGGNKIIQIGRVEIPLVPVLLVLFALAVVGIGAYWWFFVPERMSGGFKVAVAQFGQVDAQGNVQSSDDGNKLSQFIYEQLKTEFDSLMQDAAIKQDFSPQLWHDSLGPFQKRATIGLIPDKSPEKEKALEALAAKLNADVIIYGNLAVNQNVASFEPQFYIPQSVKTEADEITGNTQLGAPVTIPLPVDLDKTGERRSLNKNLASRSYALTQFTLGLLYDLFGDHDRAYTVFTKAETNLTDWDDNQGKEILYYFIAREAWSLADHKNLKRVFASADEALQKAKEALDKGR